MTDFHRLFTTDEKDAIRQDAMRAYQDCYGPIPDDGDVERYYVSKGIEAMSAVLYTAHAEKLNAMFPDPGRGPGE